MEKKKYILQSNNLHGALSKIDISNEIIEVTDDMDKAIVFDRMGDAMEFFSGIYKKLMSDNMKTSLLDKFLSFRVMSI